MLPGKTCHGAPATAPTGSQRWPAATWHGRCIGPGEMETTAYIALSRQMALRRQMDVIANNVANMTASGFKAEAP